MSKPRVLLVGWRTHPTIYGGLEVHLERVFSFLRQEEGLDVWMALPSWEGRASPYSISPNEKVINVHLPHSENIIENSIHYASRLKRLVKSEKFDVIHTHDWMGIMLANHLGKDVRWVHTHHSFWFTRQAFEHENDELRRLEEIADKASFVFTVSRLMEKEATRRGMRIDSVTYGGPTFSSQDIVRYFQHHAKTKDDESSCFLYVGRLTRHKGVDVLLCAYRRYLDESSEPAKLVIIGDGELRDKLRTLAGLLGLENMVEFRGFVEKNELLEAYSKARAVVHPAHFEPYGISLVDCAVLNIPLLCSERCGALEVIENVQTFRSVAVEELAEALIAFDYSAEKLTPPSCDLKRACWERVSNEYCEAYLSLV